MASLEAPFVDELAPVAPEAEAAVAPAMHSLDAAAEEDASDNSNAGGGTAAFRQA